MNLDRSIVREICIVAIGETVLCALMVGVFALLGYYSPKVLYGALLGGGLSVANFAIMALSVCIASKGATDQDVKAGSATMRGSMALRYVLLLVVLVFAAKSGRFHPISLLLPLIFVRPLISLGELFRKSGDKPT